MSEEEQIQRTFADLFSGVMQEDVPEAADSETAADSGEEFTPETLPVIKNPEKKLPLIFSEQSPIPSRGGEPEFPERTTPHCDTVKPRTGFQPLRMEQIPADATGGQILKQARTCAGYSLDELRGVSRLSERYLLAMENDQFDRFPLPVYLDAYLRTLGELYALPEDILHMVREHFYAKIKQQNKLPSELIRKGSANKQFNEAEERRISRIFTAITMAVGIAIILGIWAVVAAVVKHAGTQAETEPVNSAAVVQTDPVKPASPPVRFDQNKFGDLTAPRLWELNTLKMSSRPTVRRAE